jgi:thioredoxin reductase
MDFLLQLVISQFRNFQGFVDMDEAGYIKTFRFIKTNVEAVFAAAMCRIKFIARL